MDKRKKVASSTTNLPNYEGKLTKNLWNNLEKREK